MGWHRPGHLLPLPCCALKSIHCPVHMKISSMEQSVGDSLLGMKGKIAGLAPDDLLWDLLLQKASFRDLLLEDDDRSCWSLWLAALPEMSSEVFWSLFSTQLGLCCPHAPLIPFPSWDCVDFFSFSSPGRNIKHWWYFFLGWSITYLPIRNTVALTSPWGFGAVLELWRWKAGRAVVRGSRSCWPKVVISIRDHCLSRSRWPT